MAEREKSATAERGGTVARIESALVEDISTGALAPGEHLDEVGLSKRFAVSRTPVREALSRLTAQGILVQGKKRGVRVAEYSPEQLAHLFEVMHEIEVACARIASQRMTLLSRAEIIEKQDICLMTAEAGDRRGYLIANERFHEAIYRATGNPYIAEIASEFRRRTGPFRARRFATKEDLLSSAHNHKILIDHLFSEDLKVASDEMRHHMANSYLTVLRANLE